MCYQIHKTYDRCSHIEYITITHCPTRSALQQATGLGPALSVSFSADKICELDSVDGTRGYRLLNSDEWCKPCVLENERRSEIEARVRAERERVMVQGEWKMRQKVVTKGQRELREILQRALEGELERKNESFGRLADWLSEVRRK